MGKNRTCGLKRWESGERFLELGGKKRQGLCTRASIKGKSVVETSIRQIDLLSWAKGGEAVGASGEGEMEFMLDLGG